MAGDVLSQLQQLLAGVSASYPGLGKVLSDADVVYGQPPAGGEGRYMEYQPPWERDNPSAGRNRFELYPRFAGETPQAQQQMLAGDALHYWGSIDPRTGEAVDPEWQGLKQQFAGSLTPEQNAVDRRAYEREGDPRSFEDWRQQSRLDAYLRGGLFPQANPEWQKPGIFSPEQQDLLMRMYDRITLPGLRGPQLAQ